ncbi:MAG: TOPRIM nucleotidyl transferase/hydrolase domain-containing protein [Gaiellaceae bacterium]|jgi:hypothetical protein
MGSESKTPNEATASNVHYRFRAACDADAFSQFRLIDPSRLSREARERGIKCSPFDSTLFEQLERFDHEGAFCPILFEKLDEDGNYVPVFRDEVVFVPWKEYVVDDGGTVKPRPFYSPWQLLYFNEALEMRDVSVSVDRLLNDEQRKDISDFHRNLYSAQLENWRKLDQAWRDILLVLIRLSSNYGPWVKGSLMKSTVTLVLSPETGEHVDPRELEPPFDPEGILADLGVGADVIKEMHQRLAVHGTRDDPLERWHMLVRMAPASERAKLRGVARRAQDAYDGAEMLRNFYYDLTGELLLNPDEIFDISDKSWKQRLFGRWPLRSFTRADLAVELRRHDLHPHQVHIVVEGDTEEIVCRRILEAATGRPMNEFGISMHRLQGVDSAQLQREMLRALKAFPRYVVLIADREGTIGQEVARLQEEGTISAESTLLWPTSFEEATFSDDELITMIAAIGAESGATLTLDAKTLRLLYEEHRERAGKEARGLATFALGKAAQPGYGSVRVSKTQLAERIAEYLLEDIRARGADVVGEQRPIVKMLASILRVT